MAKAEKTKTESKKKLWMVPLRQISGNTNNRNPLSRELTKACEEAGITESNNGLPPIWALAVSDNPDDRARFVELVTTHDPELTAMGQQIASVGLLEPVEVREGGSGKFILNFGCRRSLATLLNWCMTGRPAEPVIEAILFKGNQASCYSHAIIENTRKQPSPIETARGWQTILNLGVEMKELAAEQGVSDQTIKRYLSLLALPPAIQRKVDEGTMTMAKALEKGKAASNGDGDTEDGEGDSEGTGEACGDSKPTRNRTRKFPEVEEALTEFNEGSIAHNVLLWVLRRREKIT